MDDAVCIINIGPMQRRRRRNLGIASLVLAVAVVLTAWVLALPAVVRLTATVFFFGGFAGIFQARAKT